MLRRSHILTAGLGATGLLALIAIGAGAAVAGGYRLGRHDPHPAR